MTDEGRGVTEQEDAEEPHPSWPPLSSALFVAAVLSRLF
jgi:hypothetical protein